MHQDLIKEDCTRLRGLGEVRITGLDDRIEGLLSIALLA